MNQKSKGSGFEREISKKLSLFLSEGKQDDLFWRTQNSGGRFTVRNKKNIDTHNQSGDISSTNPSSDWFSEKVSIECKHYKNINLWSMLTGAKSGVLGFWNQCVGDGEKSNKSPILIARQNYKPVLMIVDSMQLISGLYELGLQPKLIICKNEEINLKLNMFVYLFEEFLEIDSSQLKKIWINMDEK